eukprot:1248586-Prorocentrum_lima.AAC.1
MIKRSTEHATGHHPCQDGSNEELNYKWAWREKPDQRCTAECSTVGSLDVIAEAEEKLLALRLGRWMSTP